jgi:4-diphosphocytidyl-2C-methyl-D-erythritol kinase
VQSARVHALASQRTLSDDAPFNDLAAPALAVEPILEDDVADVRAATGRTVHVSGSGSTLYVLCNGRLEADLLAEQVRSRSGLPAVAASVRGL